MKLCCFIQGYPISACIQKTLFEQWTYYATPLLRHSCSVALVKVLSSPSLVSMLLGSRKGAQAGRDGWGRQLCSCVAINAQHDPGERRLQVVLLGATQSPMVSESTPVSTGVA